MLAALCACSACRAAKSSRSEASASIEAVAVADSSAVSVAAFDFSAFAEAQLDSVVVITTVAPDSARSICFRAASVKLARKQNARAEVAQVVNTADSLVVVADSAMAADSASKPVSLLVLNIVVIGLITLCGCALAREALRRFG